jgi:hypothetical protein
VILASTNALAGQIHCKADPDCSKLGAAYRCVAQKTACAEHPESSTCVERVCRKKPGWPLTDADRVCKKDGDCAIVLLSCQCMYCARPTDFLEGLVAAVNRKRAKAYASLGKCSEAQRRSCATAGACAMTGASEARCRARSCVVEYVPWSAE